MNTKTPSFSQELLLKIGASCGIIDADNIALLPNFLLYLSHNGFEPLQQKMVRYRICRPYNYKLSFLVDLLTFLKKEIVFTKKEFHFAFSDRSIEREFSINRGTLFYLKNSDPVDYDILRDAFTYRATRGSSQFFQQHRDQMPQLNPAMQLYTLITFALYKSGNPHIGFSSIAAHLHQCGLPGYKSYSSITKAFSSNSAGVRFLEHIVTAYNIEITIQDSTSSPSPYPPLSDLHSDSVNSLIEHYYGKGGVTLPKILKHCDCNEVLKEAVLYKKGY